MDQPIKKNNFHLEISPKEFDVAQTLDCGQCFRFTKESENCFSGIVENHFLRIEQTKTEVIFHNTTQKEYETIWKSYFDLDRDYNNIKQALSFDPTLKKAIDYAGGIRILKQPAFEALCCFIISQNNNIPRIKGCVDKLCEVLGTPIIKGRYSFPTPEALSKLSKEDLKEISLGYRDEYLLDCAQKVVSGELDLAQVATAEISVARDLLRSVKGIGPKVAECVLLFGFHRLEAFPIDTWIKKVITKYYPNGFPQQAFAYQGIAQQYLFHTIRTHKNELDG